MQEIIEHRDSINRQLALRCVPMTDAVQRKAKASVCGWQNCKGVSKMDQIVVDLGLSVHERWELHKNHIAPLPGNDGASVSAS